ncbi:FGGY family carbohydrate kinase [Streptomyces sp900105245]|uniref:FGGY family carbohydrate kinase n=1 Tax=Streptomyces sp. 900105245 TaxID=3154379 RepID=A0ABV1UKN3_9ACTN
MIGCDLGSQSAKAVLMAANGDIVATGTSGYTMQHPHSGWADQDPADYRNAITRSVRAVMQRTGVPRSAITHIGFSSQVDGVVPIDSTHTPLRPAIIWLDRRGVAEVARLEQTIGEDTLFARTGLNLDASHTAPKYMWLRDNEPEVYSAALALPSVGSYAVAWLTGTVVQDHANSSSTLLYDVSARDWSNELIAAAGLDRSKLPEIKDASDVAGTLTLQAAEALGLTTACQVVVGTGDDHASCLGAGGIRPGVVIDIIGTAEPVGVASDKPVFDPTRVVETHAHATPGSYLIENPGFVSGGNTLWFAKNILGTDQSTFFSLASQSVPGANGVRFIPALSGSMTPRWNDRIRGAFSGLGMNHTSSDLARAILEGNAFAFRDIHDRLSAMGLARSVRAVGGGARSTLWLSAKATLCRTPIQRVTTSETSAAGGAILAAVAAGYFSTFEEAVESVVTLDPAIIEPDESAIAAYDDAYHEYRALFDAVEKIA